MIGDKLMKQSTTSTSSAGIAVDSEESKAIDDVTVIEERNVALGKLVTKSNKNQQNQQKRRLF